MSAKEIDREAPASIVAKKFGNPHKLAQAIKRTPSTVHNWLLDGFIPHKFHDEVIAAAREQNIKLRPTDFVDVRKFAKAAPEAEADA
jgi:hypothetical protein